MFSEVTIKCSKVQVPDHIILPADPAARVQELRRLLSQQYLQAHRLQLPRKGEV